MGLAKTLNTTGLPGPVHSWAVLGGPGRRSGLGMVSVGISLATMPPFSLIFLNDKANLIPVAKKKKKVQGLLWCLQTPFYRGLRQATGQELRGHLGRSGPGGPELGATTKRRYGSPSSDLITATMMHYQFLPRDTCVSVKKLACRGCKTDWVEPHHGIHGLLHSHHTSQACSQNGGAHRKAYSFFWLGIRMSEKRTVRTNEC